MSYKLIEVDLTNDIRWSDVRRVIIPPFTPVWVKKYPNGHWHLVELGYPTYIPAKYTWVRNPERNPEYELSRSSTKPDRIAACGAKRINSRWHATHRGPSLPPDIADRACEECAGKWAAAKLAADTPKPTTPVYSACCITCDGTREVCFYCQKPRYQCPCVESTQPGMPSTFSPVICPACLGSGFEAIRRSPPVT